jgi:hypothetical protein
MKMHSKRPAGDSMRPKGRAAAAGAGFSTGEGEATSAPAADLGMLQTLPVFLATAGQLTLDEQKVIVAQAINMIEELYVHLPLKRAMHAIDPLQSLRLLDRQLASFSKPMPERRFHNQMIGVFVSLRDLHTNYVLPSYFAAYTAFLPFYIEEFFADQNSDDCQYVVSKMLAGFTHPQFKPGVVLKYWNGIPMDRAVELNADKNAGSNPDARHARGLENMTIRPMDMSLPPDEEWVVIGYQSGGQDLAIQLPWKIFAPNPKTGVAPTPSESGAASRAIGMDFLTESVRRAKVRLFAPHIAKRAHELTTAQTYGARPETAGVDPSTTSSMPDVLSFRAVDTPSGKIGYLRIYSFAPPSESQDASTFVAAFFAEVLRILAWLPQNGLILDVRNNGGGMIPAGERLLQLFTPRHITPERFDFINTPTVRRLVDNYSDLKTWAASVDLSLETAATYSQGFPLTSEEDANSTGQVYQGPVVLITNALIFSTTDIFTAGFQDHGIGPILGTHGNTGAGGANVFDYTSLQNVLPDLLQALPKGTSMRVALRRSTRVGAMAGMPLEDLGVIPDAVHKMTENDVFHNNVDLINHAASLLKVMKSRLLRATLDTAGGKCRLNLQTQNITRVDVYLNSRPSMSLDVKDGATAVDLPAQAAALTNIRLEGFDGSAFVAARNLALPA